MIAGLILFVVAQVPPQKLMSAGTALVPRDPAAAGGGVELFGIERKGSQRWLNVGVVIQPSELMKIAMPLMLAWWFQRREGQLKPLDFVAALDPADGARGTDSQAARSGHGPAGAGLGPVRHLFCRPELEAHRAPAGAGGGWASSH
jgi:hypothetical protein